jgi:hypothetical protein
VCFITVRFSLHFLKYVLLLLFYYLLLTANGVVPRSSGGRVPVRRLHRMYKVALLLLKFSELLNRQSECLTMTNARAECPASG